MKRSILKVVAAVAVASICSVQFVMPMGRKKKSVTKKPKQTETLQKQKNLFDGQKQTIKAIEEMLKNNKVTSGHCKNLVSEVAKDLGRLNDTKFSEKKGGKSVDKKQYLIDIENMRSSFGLQYPNFYKSLKTEHAKIAFDVFAVYHSADETVGAFKKFFKKSVESIVAEKLVKMGYEKAKVLTYDAKEKKYVEKKEGLSTLQKVLIGAGIGTGAVAAIIAAIAAVRYSKKDENKKKKFSFKEDAKGFFGLKKLFSKKDGKKK